MPPLAEGDAMDWLREQYHRAEAQRAEAAQNERAACHAWQEAMAAYDAANDATTDAWTVLREATSTEHDT